MGFKMKSSIDGLCSPLKNEQTKRAVINRKTSSYGSSGGSESTEFVKGGRKGDKTTKSTTYKKRNADTDGANPEMYIKTKTKINKKGETKTKTKEISAKKYNRQVARKKRRAARRGDDTENINS